MPPWILPVLAAPFVGSFLGVLAMRLPDNRPVALARSACDSCAHALGPRDLVPLLSFAASSGRCRHCRAPIPPAHPLIELAALGVALAAAAALPPDPTTLWSGCVLGWTALVLAWIDWRTFRLPDRLTLPLLLAGLLACAATDPQALPDRAAAAAAGWLAFRLLSAAYHRLRGRPGLGAGDAKLLAAGGAWLGLADLPLMVLCGALATLALALALAAIRGRGHLRPDLAIPFGPGLALALWALWLCLTPDAPPTLG